MKPFANSLHAFWTHKGLDPFAIKERARGLLPGAKERAEETWAALLATDAPTAEQQQDQFLAAALLLALEELATA